MSSSPIPTVFEPLCKPKPWGGRTLATLFNKPLPPGEPIGETWELVSLPDNESRVKQGPLAGRTLSSLVQQWGPALYGHAPLADGRFPLLIKFLDAREHLSVQVHPHPGTQAVHPASLAIKHEAWYVLHADPDAELFVGVNPGVTLADLAGAADTPTTAKLLRRRPVARGDCFYLPSGIVHALGAGIVVAEIQTPSDVTYRFYDWDRVGLDGQPRPLHIRQALENAWLDVPETEVVQARRPVEGSFANAVRITSCARFLIDYVQLPPDLDQPVPHRGMAAWIVLAGTGTLHRDHSQCPFRSGDVVLIPADHAGTHVVSSQPCELLTVEVPPRA